jgi:hypothetical protein
MYHPQGNGQVENINMVFGTLLTKLVNENKNDWDEHLSTIFFSYWTVYKVGIGHTPFQLVYKLHPLLPTKLSPKLSEHVDPTPIRILISQLLELKKLQENGLITYDLVVSN